MVQVRDLDEILFGFFHPQNVFAFFLTILGFLTLSQGPGMLEKNFKKFLFADKLGPGSRAVTRGYFMQLTFKTREIAKLRTIQRISFLFLISFLTFYAF
jgi:ascorbate-specific PTS system EIIC-type component UlaA